MSEENQSNEQDDSEEYEYETVEKVDMDFHKTKQGFKPNTRFPGILTKQAQWAAMEVLPVKVGTGGIVEMLNMRKVILDECKAQWNYIFSKAAPALPKETKMSKTARARLAGINKTPEKVAAAIENLRKARERSNEIKALREAGFNIGQPIAKAKPRKQPKAKYDPKAAVSLHIGEDREKLLKMQQDKENQLSESVKRFIELNKQKNNGTTETSKEDR